MEKVNRIIKHPKYIEHLNKIKKLEMNRRFCSHSIGHFLDTARIGYILILERKLPIEKEEIYGAALLHDVGKWKEYIDGISHEKASVILAEEILENVGYSKEQIARIKEAIGNHRNRENEKNTFSEILFLSDKASRNCFCCIAEKECNWSLEKKNLEIQY